VTYRDRTGDMIPTDHGLVMVTGRHSRNSKRGQALWVTRVRQGDGQENTRIFRSYELSRLARDNGLSWAQCADLGKRLRQADE
jgi:hypothetical protein